MLVNILASANGPFAAYSVTGGRLSQLVPNRPPPAAPALALPPGESAPADPAFAPFSDPPCELVPAPPVAAADPPDAATPPEPGPPGRPPAPDEVPAEALLGGTP